MNVPHEHQSFVEWMKAVGMFLIVIGHVFGSPHSPFNDYFQPIYTKQLGVAFFVFVTGWSLMNEKRERFTVAFYRIFPIFFYGIVIAVTLSLIFYFLGKDINESNYLPFLFGVNVLFNYFPANPTTWYIGTYFHLIIFWLVFFHNRKVTAIHLVIGLVLENVVRMTLIYFNKDFVAYMTLPNWLSIFLIGMYLHDKKDVTVTLYSIGKVVLLAVLATLWVYFINTFEFDNSFPFRKSSISNVALQSMSISATYIIYTMLVFYIFRNLPTLKIISVLSKNTLLIFILHMPIIYEFSPVIYRYITNDFIKRVVMISISYIGIAIFSILVHKYIRINSLRNCMWDMISRYRTT